MRYSRLLISFLMSFIWLLVATGCGDSYQELVEREAEQQKSWPSWPEFEVAVPKPEWWHSVPIKYLDPMNYTPEEMKAYHDKNTGIDKYKRDFKVLYARMLKNRGNDVQEMAGFLGRGTVREFNPLYAFYISNYMDETWQSEHCGQCNDANAAINIGTQWLYRLIEDGEYGRAQQVIAQLFKLKYARAIPMQRYYLIRSYRHLLLKTQSRDEAYAILKPYIVNNITLAEHANDQNMMQRWMNL
ncbi:hypothetical protein [Pseudoalteromonas piratica]|uniref:Lipoprotein n=1 Tax=Pseudoalteromonas piratica TaxID=1348114 RepID=A0A0A7END2_9GAMM|nr:hypothetical protein [Pseudoalteromonas piratica]AIY67586.1 hypothetical protein OM33_21575 [Pseudoalteromonas piratica]